MRTVRQSRVFTRGANPSIRGIFSTFTVNVINMGAGVVTGVATARAFEPSLRGVLIAVTIWVGTISTFSLVGLDESIVFHSRGNGSDAWSIRTALSKALRGQGLIAAAALVFIIASIVRDYGRGVTIVSLSTLLIVPMNLYVQPVMAELRATERFLVWNLIRLIPAGIYSGGTVIMVLLDRFSLTAGLIALILGNVLTALACWITSRSNHRGEIPRQVPPAEVATVRRYGRGVVLAMLPYVANQRMDQLFLGLIVAPRYLGVYAVAVSVCAVVQMIGTTIEQVTFPRLVSGTMERDRVPSAMLVSLLLAASAGGIIALFAEPMVRFVYGSDYVGAVTPLRIIMLGVVFVVASSVLTAEAMSDGRLRDLVRAQLVGLVVTVVALPSLVYFAGLTGAAEASAIAYIVSFISLWHSRRVARRRVAVL